MNRPARGGVLDGWHPMATLVAAVIIAVAVLLDGAAPGPARLRADYQAHGSGSVTSGSITVEDVRIRTGTSATFAGVECPEDAVFIVVQARYRFTEPGKALRRGLLIGDTRYVPSACQDDLAGAAAVPGEHFTLDTVFAVDRETFAGLRGKRLALRVGQLDPWYDNLGPAVVVDLFMPVTAPEQLVEAEARR